MVNPIQSTRIRTAISKIANPDALLPVILLETAVTSGRAYQAYQRDKRNNLGKPIETQERLFEDISSAIVWLGGVWALNKVGDFFGKNLFGIKNTNFDVGKDNVRTPFENLLKDNPSFSKTKYSVFKFGKIISSVIAATILVGFIIPKVKRKLSQKDSEQSPTQPPNNFLENFAKETNPKKSHKNTSFGFNLSCTELLNISAHNIENHPIYRLLATDTGIITGRNINAKDNDERIEISFRDMSSVYFYLFSTKHIVGAFNKLETYKNIAKLNVNTALTLSNYLISKLNSEKLPAEEFKNLALGFTDEKLLSEIPMKNEVTTLAEFKRLTPHEYHKKAEFLSGMQPEKADTGRILTLEQVKDALSKGWLSEEKFLDEVFTKAFEDSKGNDILRSKYSYIPQSKIKDLRNRITGYVEDLVEYAKQNSSGEITEELIKKLNRKNLFKNGLYSSIGFAISALFLSTIIPKLQYAITKHRTGKDTFPGLEKQS